MYEYNLGICFETIAEQRAQQTAIWCNAQQAISYESLNRPDPVGLMTTDKSRRIIGD